MCTKYIQRCYGWIKFTTAYRSNDLDSVQKWYSPKYDTEYILIDVLYTTCTLGHYEVSAWLMNQSNHIIDMNMLLTWACSSNNLKLIKYIVSKGGSPDYNSALAEACKRGHLNVVQYFHQHGSLIQRDSESGVNLCLFIACVFNQYHIAYYLVCHGYAFKKASPRAKKYIRQKRTWLRWRRYCVQKWARQVLKIYYRPDMPGGVMAKKDIISSLSLES
jgi:hypothetical protein